MSEANEIVDRDVTPERYGPGTFGCHEALDRTSILMHQAYELAEHGAILLNDEWKAMALKAAESLFDLYQSIGAVHLEAMPPVGRQISPVEAGGAIEAAAAHPTPDIAAHGPENGPTRDAGSGGEP